MLFLLLAAAAPTGAPITVAVTNITKAEGRVHVDICPERNFVTTACPYSGEATAVAGTTIVTIANVPPGRYAAQGFHDRNGNGKADRGMFGIPLEPVGFSNDAPVRFAPPKFADAAFAHGTMPQRITFKARKLP